MRQRFYSRVYRYRPFDRVHLSESGFPGDAIPFAQARFSV